MRKTTTAVMLIALLAFAAPALAGPGPEEHLDLAKKLQDMGEHARAVAVLRAMVLKWPDEPEFVPQAYLHLARSLAELGRIEEAIDVLERTADRYADRPEIRRGALTQREELERKLDAQREEKVDHEWIERDLKEKGLRGEELEREYRRMVSEYEEAKRAHAEADAAAERARREAARIEEMARLWREGGASPEEIAERSARLDVERARIEALHNQLKAEQQRLAAAGLPPDEIRRGVEKLRDRLTRESGDDWERRRDEEMADLRSEFLHLAERLGIPGEDAERFLEEHRRRQLGIGVRHPSRKRSEAPPDRPFHGPKTDRGGLERRLEEMEKKLNHLLERLEAVEEAMKAR